MVKRSAPFWPDPAPFTRQQEARIRELIAQAVVAARIIHPDDCTPKTQAAIGRAIREGA